MHDFIVLGSGPSATAHLQSVLEKYPNAGVAAVNGSYALLQKPPDAYGIFENRAIAVYKEKACEFAERGTHIFAHARFGKRWLKCPFVPVSQMYVYDRFHLPFDEGKQAGQPMGAGRGLGLGMGSGTLMMVCVAQEYSPSRIHIVGCDGYETDAVYADGVAVSPTANMKPNAKICEQSNYCAGRHIQHITNILFPTVQFLWYGIPRHPNAQKWRMKFV